MKRSLISKSLILIFMSFIGFMCVNAESESMALNAVKIGDAALLCDYSGVDDEGRPEGVRIYYYFTTDADNKFFDVETGKWEFLYQVDGKSFKDLGNDSYGYTQNIITNKGSRINLKAPGKHFSSNIDNTFTCPEYAFYEREGNYSFCFSDKKTCSTMTHGPFKLATNSSTIFGVIDSYVVDSLNEVGLNDLEIDYESKEFDKKQVGDLVKDKILKKVKTKYQFDSKYIMPGFVENYIKGANIDIPKEKFENWQDKVDNQITTEEEAKNITSEEADFYREVVGSLTVDQIIDAPSSIIDLDISDELSCDGLLGTEMSELVKKGFDFVKFGGPILVAVFTIIDFLKASLSGEADDLKKSSNKFVKRAIAGVLLFFIPIICNMLFDFAGITVPDVCIGNGTETQETVENEKEE